MDSLSETKQGSVNQGRSEATCTLSTTAAESELIDSNSVVSRRQWQQVDADCSELSNSDASVTVMTYNVLAQSYTSHKVFSSSPRWTLRATPRRRANVQHICAHVEDHNVDILCLQELESELKAALSRQLSDFVFTAYKKRTAANGKEKRDGSGIFWRRDKFNCVHDNANENHIELNDISQDVNYLPLIGEADGARRDCVCAVVCLQELETGITLVIACAHLFWNPIYPLVKLAQAIRVRRAAIDLAEKHGAKHVILAGDWNSMPNSSAFSFLENGKVPVNHPEMLQLEDMDVLQYVNDESKAHFRLRSVHRFAATAEVDGDDPFGGRQSEAFESEITTFTCKFKGALDHIFVNDNKSRVHVVEVLSLPRPSDFKKLGISGLPWANFPSDHLPVVVRLVLKRDYKEKPDKAELDKEAADI